MKRWIIKKPNKEISEKLQREAEITPLCADVLSARGFESCEDTVNKLFIEELYDPFILKDMTEAADIINEAIENADRICVYGDYDCDGITSTVMLYSYLDCMGADVIYRLPERNEGYGLNEDVIKEIAQQDVKLIVTVDNGISAINEAELIYSLGMRLIVTDHHQPGEELPKADAIVNPHRKDCPSVFKKLCGAGVVFKLIAALEGGDYETALNEYGELAAIGTVADIVELSGENRFIVSNGMRLMENSDRCGIHALMNKSGVKHPVTSTALAFSIAPRINASGRFGSPALAAKLLMTEDEQEAESLCEQLDKLNNSRKDTENEILENIGNTINSNPNITTNRVLVLSGENWHHGVIGIVAARLLDRFDKPCFIISIEGDTARGSARAFGDFSVYKALDYCSELLLKYGGHMGAGGFSIKTKDIPELERKLQEYARKNFNTMPVPDIVADKLITPNEMTLDNIEGLKILEPFGEGNGQPVFAMIGAEIIHVASLSKGLHTKLIVKYGGNQLELLLFRHNPDEIFLKKGDKADFMVTLNTQIYNGKNQLNIIVKDFRKNGMEQRKFFAASDAYERFKRNEELPPAYYQKICPDRQELIPIYKTIAQGKYTPETLYMSVASDNMNYCKLKICVDIFKELGLVDYNCYLQQVNAVKNAPKADLNKSHILNTLKSKLQ